MKQVIRLTSLFFACALLVLTVVAGPEPLSSGKEMKQVAPAPAPECNWSGFYIGLNVGGQFGHSEDKDLDGFWNGPTRRNLPWGYSESGVIAGGQVGYNFQWNWLVLGVEGDLRYVNLEGHGDIKGSDLPSQSAFGPVVGESDSDFYTTIRGRIGFALNHWLFYGTGGGIGVNYKTGVFDNATHFSGDKQEFDWGYTVGGGIEYMLGCHWSLRAEYLYFATDTQRFSISSTRTSTIYDFDGNTEGHIVRGALNYKF